MTLLTEARSLFSGQVEKPGSRLVSSGLKRGSGLEVDFFFLHTVVSVPTAALTSVEQTRFLFRPFASEILRWERSRDRR